MIQVYIDKNTKKSILKSCNALDDNLTCIYFLKLKGSIVYIGKTKNVKSRVLSHLYLKEKSFDSFDIKECVSDELDDLERYYIGIHNPVYNCNLRTANFHTTLQDHLIANKINFSVDIHDKYELNTTLELLKIKFSKFKISFIFNNE